MKFENSQSNATTTTGAQIEEMSTAEQVALAKLENDLKSLKLGGALPELNLESFSATGKNKVASMG